MASALNETLKALYIEILKPVPWWWKISSTHDKCRLRANHNDMYVSTGSNLFNSPPPGQNGRHFADVVFRYVFVNEKLKILIKISLKFVFKDPIDNNPALV